jgi:uncharacterized membrane protein
VNTNRLEAFSDGVLAVAITLLVLDIHVPPTDSHATLAQNLGHLWPNYVAYAISFLTIGIIWMNHHVMISRLRSADHAILVLNLLLLMSIVLLPFATAVMSAYLRESHGQHLAAAVYGGALLAMSITFSALLGHIMFAKSHLLAVELPRARRRQIWIRSGGGIPPYVIATALAPVSAYATLIITGALAAFYALPFASGGREPVSTP